ncbi:MAG TPA: hypothetical protein PKN21_14160, partial [Bacteroidales bacterium]|nr:hypothetical protein [Bacteroidales bacterium]
MAVLIYLEHWEGKFKKLSFELVSYASKIAEMIGSQSIALTIGTVDEQELEKLALHGVDKVIHIENQKLDTLDEQAYTNLVSDAARNYNATVLVLSNNNSGKALAPRLSVQLKAGLVSGVSKLPVSISPFVVYKKVYSGKAYVN